MKTPSRLKTPAATLRRWSSALAVAAALAAPIAAHAAFGTWTPLTNTMPNAGMGTMLLMTNGTVLVQGGDNGDVSNQWYKLTPDASGSYINGTWTQVASAHVQRLYDVSTVLKNGRLFIAGGEYTSMNGDNSNNYGNTAEVYDPVADTWTSTPNGPLGDIGDVPAKALPNDADGRVLVGYRGGGQTSFYDPVTNAWSAAGTKPNGDSSDEESWELLPDGSILDVEVFNPNGALKYIPSSNTWISAGTTVSTLPSTDGGYEIGATVLLGNGKALCLGGSGKTGVYTPPATVTDPGTWAAGPTMPGSLQAYDAPAAVEPNGKVLCQLASGYNSPSTFVEYVPGTNTFQTLPTPSFGNSYAPYYSRMLVLPTGQILFNMYSNQAYVYTPVSGGNPNWKPTIGSITKLSTGVYLLKGKQFNGVSEGASYGDDASMSSNYPLVRLTDGTGNVTYARTYSFSSMGVATGTASVSTKFQLPAGLAAGTYSLEVVANGIASKKATFVVH